MALAFLYRKSQSEEFFTFQEAAAIVGDRRAARTNLRRLAGHGNAPSKRYFEQFSQRTGFLTITREKIYRVVQLIDGICPSDFQEPRLPSLEF